jgi:hypothetical protein
VSEQLEAPTTAAKAISGIARCTLAIMVSNRD